MIENFHIIIGALSDVGCEREHNEDYLGHFIKNAGKKDSSIIAIVADGMGGAAAGEIASKIAVNTILNIYTNHPSENILEILEEALLGTKEEMLTTAQNEAHLRGMGTTIVAIVLKNETAYYAHIGDSRIYYISSNETKQLTQDHSMVQELLRKGIITYEEAKHHPNANIITRVLGTHKKVEPEFAIYEPLKAGDMFVLCSDGLSNLIDEEEIAISVRKNEPNEACKELVELAKKRGGNDNITIIILKVIEKE